MNKQITNKLKLALLSATLVGGGIVGAGSLVADASDDGISDTPAAVDSAAGGPNGLQTPTDETDANPTDTNPAEGDTESDQTESDEGGEREGRRGRRGCGGNEAIAELLGLTTDELHEAREDGSTLAEIAAAQGVDADDVVAAIVEEKAERLEAKIADGELTEAEAAERLAEVQERAEERVNGAEDA